MPTYPAKLVLSASLVAFAVLGAGVASAHHEPFRVKQLLGESVHDLAGKVVGKVDDLVVEHDDVLSAVIAVGGIAGVGAKLVAVPCHDFEFKHEDSLWHVSMTEAQLKALPEFDPDKSPAQMVTHHQP